MRCFGLVKYGFRLLGSWYRSLKSDIGCHIVVLWLYERRNGIKEHHGIACWSLLCARPRTYVMTLCPSIVTLYLAS